MLPQALSQSSSAPKQGIPDSIASLSSAPPPKTGTPTRCRCMNILCMEHSIQVRWCSMRYTTGHMRNIIMQHSQGPCCTVHYSTVQRSTVRYTTVWQSIAAYSTVQYKNITALLSSETVQYSQVLYCTVLHRMVQYNTVQQIHSTTTSQ